MALDKETLKSNIQAAFDAASDVSVEEYTDEDTGVLDTESFSTAILESMSTAFAEAIFTFIEGAEVDGVEATLDSLSFTGNLLVSEDKIKLTGDGNKHYYTLNSHLPPASDAIDDGDIAEPTISGNVTISGGKLK